MLRQKEVNRDNEVKENEEDEGNNFRIEKGKNFLCFMKHCFTDKKIFKPSTMVKVAMKEKTNSNIIIKNGQKNIQPTINIKINEYFCSSFFFLLRRYINLSNLLIMISLIKENLT